MATKYTLRTTFFKASSDSIIRPEDADVLSEHENLKDAVAAQQKSAIRCFVYDEVYDIPLYWHQWNAPKNDTDAIPSGAD